MRLRFTGVLFGLLALPALAADKDEDKDKAKEAAVAFLKAMKAKDIDAMMKVSAVPFSYRENKKVDGFKDTNALKKWLKEKLDEIKEPDKLPTKLSLIKPVADIEDEKFRRILELVTGKDGFMVVTSSDEKVVPILLVRIKEGKAQIVGVWR